MLDADRLRSQLMAALLLTAGACDGDAQPSSQKLAEAKSDPKAEPEPEPEPEPKPEPEPEPEPEPKPEPEPEVEPKPEPKPKLEPEPKPEVGEVPKERPRPRCPSGQWCGTKKSAKPIAAKGAKLQMGCPDRLNPDPSKIDPSSTEYITLLGSSRTVAMFDSTATSDKRAAGEGDACCYTWVERCPGGRPVLSADGGMVRPQARVRPNEIADEGKRRAALGWVEDARLEYASVASFRRAAQELRNVGAPSGLVEAAMEAAADEERHTRLCLDAAAQLGTGAIELESMPPAPVRTATLSQLARDTFAEGGVGETVAALAASEAAKRCHDDRLRAALEQIAQDESRHAQLAWQTIGWALQAGGDEVRQALRDEADRARVALTKLPAEPKATRELERWGRLDDVTLARVRHQAWHDVIAPLLASLNTPSVRA